MKYDVIGLSYYPFGLKRLYRDDSRFREQFKDMASRYNKVMVVEVGGIDEQIETSNADCYDKSGEKTCQITRVGCYLLGTTRAKSWTAIL
jgi:arabinogalactan endo-1,4-beta-galactosidase